jgi:uncharacterized phage protein gp47/JayE
MSYVRPTFTQLKTRIESDLTDFVTALRDALSVAWAKVIHGVHGHIEWVDAQCSPLTCDLERLYDWAALYAVNRLNPFPSSGQIIVTGNVGAIVLAGALFRGDNGFDYITSVATTLAAGNNNISVTCTTAGAITNLSAGQLLTLVDPIAGVDSTTTVGASGLTGGVDLEDVHAWRARVVDEWQVVVSQGERSGKINDYKAWAKSAHASVSAALVQTHTIGFGSIVVRPICNNLVDRLPTQAVLDAVSIYLASPGVAPANADIYVQVPLRKFVNVTLDLDAAVDTAPNRAAIVAAINNSILAEFSENSVLLMAELDAAIATVTTQYVRIAPTDNISVSAGEILVLAGVAFT